MRDATRDVRFLSSIICGLLCVANLMLAAHSITIQWNWRNTIPYLDTLDVLNFLDRGSSLTIADYFNFNHNAHKLFLSLYVFEIDHYWFGARGIVLYPILYVASAVLALVSVNWLFAGSITPTARASAISVSFAFFFWLGHYENLTWDIQIAELLSLVFAVLACFAAALVGNGRNQSWKRDVLAAAVSALLASSSSCLSLYGVAVFPIIGCHAVLARWRGPAFFVFLGLAILTLATFFLSQRHSLANSPLMLQSSLTLRYGISLATYIGVLLSGPIWSGIDSFLGNSIRFGSVSDPTLSLLRAVPAWLAIVAVAILATRRYRGRHAVSSRYEAIYFDLAVLIAGTACSMAALVALGRFILGNPTSSRYMVVGSLFWMAVFGLAVLCTRPYFRTSTIAVTSATLYAILFASTSHFEQVVRNRAQFLVSAGVAASYDNYTLLYPFPQAPDVRAIWLRRRDPYPSFREAIPFGWLQHRISDFPAFTESYCLGHIDTTNLSPLSGREFLSVEGWGVIANRPAPEWLAIVNSDGIILGVGRPGLMRQDVYNGLRTLGVKGERDAMTYSGFRILAAAKKDAKLSLWLIDRSGRAYAAKFGNS
jgi:hypothetical protein